MDSRDTLLLACGTSASRAALRTIFEADFNLLEADNIKQTKLFLEQNHSCIAVVILDLTTLEKVDKKFLRETTRSPLLREIPFVIISDDTSSENRIHLFEQGATDVYSTSTDPYVLQRRIHNIVELHRHRWHLEELLKEQEEILRHSNDAIVDTLSSIIEYRSIESGQHILRIRRFTQLLLEAVSLTCPEYGLTAEQIRLISSASALHDIGKISIPDSILNKPGALSPEEWEIMKSHSLTGCRILESLNDFVNHEYLRYAHNICHYHHERWDGRGYPEGLTGDDIPICAQVVGLVDAYDALTTNRVYKSAYSFEQSMNMIVNGECGIFSPKLLECFKQLGQQFKELALAYADGLSPKTETFDVTLPPPVPQGGPNTLHAVQGKYQTLLHYTNVAVAEVDLDQGLYHWVYNPDPNLALLQREATFGEAQNVIAQQILLPEERERFQKVFDTDIPQFFQDGLHRQSYLFRINSRTSTSPELYRMTLLRLDPGDPTSRRMLLLWEHASAQEAADTPARILPEANAPQLAISICCRNDALLTLDRASLERLSPLVGYSPQELETTFHSSLVALVVHQDRPLIRKKFNEQLSYSRDVELTYQLHHKSGLFVWLLHKGVLAVDSNGNEFLHSILIDVTRVKSAQETHNLTLEQYQVIMALTGHIVFDWDLVSDTIIFSRTWQDIFGYTPVRDNARKVIYTDSHFHPDDIPRFLDWVDAHKNHMSPPAIELRLASSGGRYLWCRFRGTASFDNDGTASRLLGIIVNIDEEKRAATALQQQANQDPLTKLLNKQSARKQAEEYLASAAPGTRCAMMIIDLDNFKQINDQFGHMFGDAVLTQVAQELKKLFRSQDIISRIGGDEFMVLMRDIPDQELVERRCSQLLEIFDQVFNEPRYQCHLGCSIGVALSPDHGTTYHDLFLCADQALYQSKHLGKNQYTLCGDSAAKIPSQQLSQVALTRIDSDEQPSLFDANLAQVAFQRLYRANNIDSAVNDILALMGEQTNVSRVYVFENTPDNRSCNNTYEWCNNGIEPEKDNLQNISYETDIPGYEDNFNEQGIFYCPDVSELPQNLRDILEPQGIKSLLHCAIRDNGVFRGYIGFDDCSSKRLWTKEQIQILTFFSEILSTFLLKEQAQKETARRAEDLTSILDSQKDWIYVIDPDTCELKFLNAKVKTLAPDAREGMFCYRALMGLASRCPGCPAENIRQVKTCKQNFHNEQFHLHVSAEASLIRWGGEDACLLCCRELPEQD